MLKKQRAHLGKFFLLFLIFTLIFLCRSPIDQLKVWLDKAPFKSTNAQIKRDTYIAILTATMALQKGDIDKLCGDGGSLDPKCAFTLTKYLFKAFEQISNKD